MVDQRTSATTPILPRLPTRLPNALLLKNVGMKRVKKLSFSRSGSSGLVVKRNPTWATLPITETPTSMATRGESTMTMRMTALTESATMLWGVISTSVRSSRKWRRNPASSA
jgi:hypothetical protein